MKYLLLSDPHLIINSPIARLDDVAKTQIQKFSFIMKAAKKVDAILLAGDVFDKPRSWHLLSKVAPYFLNKECYAVFGQHDQYMRSSESSMATNLGILAKSKIIEILNDDPIEHDDVHIYGCSFGQEVPEILDKKRFNILVIHATIGCRKSCSDLNCEYEDAALFLKKYRFDLILCGDIHRHFVIKSNDNRYLINTGPMLRLEATKYNFEHKPCFYIFDTSERKFERCIIPHKPANEILTRSHIEKVKEREELFSKLISTITKETKKSEVDVTKKIMVICKANKVNSKVVDLISKKIEKHQGV